MPNILRNTLLCAVLATLGIGNLTSSIAQVASTSRVPIEPCNQNQQWFQVGTEKLACNQGTVWMRLSSLRKTLESKGVEITEPPVQIAGRITWYVRFPDSKRQSTLYIWQGVSYGLRQDGLADFVIDPDFIKMSEFLRMLAALDLPVTVQGWQNPTITVGKIKFSIGTSELSVAGNEFYNDVFDDEAVGNLFPGLPIINRSTNPLFDSEMLIVTTSPETFSAKSPSLTTTTHRLKISNSKPGDVFLILAREGPSTLYASADQQVTVSSVRRAYIGSVEADGFIAYKSPSQNLAISSDPLLPLNVQGGAGKISVVRFSGRIDENVRDTLNRVAPADVTIQAVK